MAGIKHRYRLLVNGKVKVSGSMADCMKEATWHDKWQVWKLKRELQGVNKAPTEWVLHKEA